MDQETPATVWRRLRLAVLGAPKSGKSTLAERLSGHYGLQVVTPGQAARHVLQHLPWTSLARDCSAWLREGATLPSDLAADCLQLYLHQPRSLARGFVLDGYPQSLEQISELEKRSLQPHLVILLEVDWQLSVEAAAAVSTHRWGEGPAHPQQLLEKRWSSWTPVLEQVEETLQQRYQNVVRLCGRRSVAHTSRRAQEAVLQVLECLQQSWSSSPDPRRLRWSGITPELFARRQSKFQHYCCLCYVLSGELVSSCLEPPPDRTGLLEWRGQFYWLCDKHLHHFLDHSESYSQLLADVHFTEHLPTPLTLSSRPDHAAVAGRCLVTYWDNLPSRVVRDGSHEFAVDYRGRTYLFCSSECLRRFCTAPQTYCDRRIPEAAYSAMPEVRVEELPTTGYLEQTLYGVLRDEVTAVGMERPKYPGMSAATSASTSLALRFKVANPLASQESRSAYGDVLKQFESRCRELISATSRLKTAVNPHCRRTSSHSHYDSLRRRPSPARSPQ